MNIYPIELSIDKKIYRLSKISSSLQKKLSKLSIIRLVLFFLIPASFYLYHIIPDASLFLLLPMFLFSIAFTYMVYYYKNHFNYRQRIDGYKNLLEREKHRLNLELDTIYDKEPSYQSIVEQNHFYKDLDIPGKFGLFNYLDVTSTKLGEKRFVQNLMRQLEDSEKSILDRQALIKELCGLRKFGINFLRYMNEARTENRNRKLELSSLHKERKSFWEGLSILRKVYIPITVIGWIAIIVLFIFDKPNILGLFGFIQILIHVITRKKSNKEFLLYDEILNSVHSLEKLILYISRTKIKSGLVSVYFMNSNSKEIEESFRSLKKVLGRVSVYKTPLLHFLLNAFFLWDLWQIDSIEKWQRKYKSQLNKWIDGVISIDSVLPFVILLWENPEYIFPEINSQLNVLSAEEMGHPLIPKKNRVNNPIDKIELSNIEIITGSNMSGKTTYLRTIGINTLLALCGSPIPAKSFSLPPLEILTSIRNQDSLQDGISFFYAEVKKLSYIINHISPQKKYLILLDEILKGTNTRERFIASKSIIAQMSELPCFTFISTHDLDLTKGKSKKYIYKHFLEIIENNQMSFDYKIKDGVVQSSNALKVLEIEGIKIT